MELLISKLWIVWATVGLILLIVEMLTPTLFFAGMGIGAFLASVAAYYGANLYWQIIIFAVFSIIFTVYIKPIFKNSLLKLPKNDTNMYAYEGEKAKVLITINNEENTGRIRVFDEEWNAKSTDGQIFEKDEIVKIKYIKDMTAYVEKDGQ